MTATTSQTSRLDPTVLRMMGILVLGVMAALLDTTVVNVAVDTLSRELRAPVSTVQWVTTGYLLALGMVIPLSGWAVARFGAKRMWLTALTLFLVGSVAAGLSWNVQSLIAFRVLQGIGGGPLFPIMQTMLVQASGGRQVGRLMSLVSLPAVLVPILGPTIGGLIVTTVDWRWVFLVNVPLCLLGIGLAWRGLPATPPSGRRPFDVLGLILLSPGLAGVLFGLSRVGDPLSFVPLVGGCVLLAGFGVHALRIGERALVDLRLFRVRSFAASSAMLFFSGLSLFGVMFLLPLYFQQVRGAPALLAGVLLAPQGLGSLLARGRVGWLADRFGPRPVALAGIGVFVLGLVIFASLPAATGFLPQSGALVLVGAGLSTATIAVMAGSYQDLRPEQVPDASSTTRILLQVGGSFGTAVLAVILARQAATQPVAQAFGITFWWTAGFAALTLIPAWLLPRR